MTKEKREIATKMPNRKFSKHDCLEKILSLVQQIMLQLPGISPLTLNLLTTTIVAPPSNASKWQM